MTGELTWGEIGCIVAFGLVFMAAAPFLLLYDIHQGTYRRWC